MTALKEGRICIEFLANIKSVSIDSLRLKLVSKPSIATEVWYVFPRRFWGLIAVLTEEIIA